MRVVCVWCAYACVCAREQITKLAAEMASLHGIDPGALSGQLEKTVGAAKKAGKTQDEVEAHLIDMVSDMLATFLATDLRPPMCVGA